MSKRPLRHIIKDFITSLNLTFDITNVQVIGDNTLFNVDNILFVRSGHYVTINSTSYKVLSTTGDYGITIAGKPTSPTKVTFETPKYYVGSPTSVLIDLQTRPRGRDKYPLIYLYEIIRERFSAYNGDRIERTADIRLFLLDESTTDWDKVLNHEQYFQMVVDGQYRFAHYLTENMNNSAYFAQLENGFDLIPYHKFGAFSEMKGVTQSIFNDTLSGVELRIDLPVLREQTTC